MGVIVLSAGVGNDVVGWILLALCVTLVNSGASLTALWILLVAVGYTLFLIYLVRPCFMYMLRRTGSLSNGPTQTVVAVTVLMVLTSAFFTGIIGIHPIFGAFMIGLMAPHEGGFAIKLTEKLEDLVSVLFLPLYFALSGLSTNLGLLNTGITWAYVVGVCAIAFFGKIAGGTLASRLNGLVWRESFTIGCLMSCKGLVELIVLNIGLQAKILSQRTFTIFVVMALITTCATTPLTTWLYPPWYQRKLELWKQGKIDWDGNLLQHDDDSDDRNEGDIAGTTGVAKKILVYLRLDGLPSMFTMVSLFDHNDGAQKNPYGPTTNETLLQDQPVVGNQVTMASTVTLRRPLQIHALRLMELTERESSVMRVAEIEEFASRDPVIKAFGTFGQSRDVAVAGQIAVVPEHSFSGTLMSRAQDLKSDLLMVPWSETGTMSEYPSLFDTRPGDPLANKAFATLASEIFEKARETCHVGVVIDKTVLCRPDPRSMESAAQERQVRQLSRTFTGVSLIDQMNSTVNFKLSDSGRHRLLALYRGSEDDLFAVRFGLQLARNPRVDLKILNVPAAHDDGVDEDEIEEIHKGSAAIHATSRAHTMHQFEALRHSIPDTLVERVSIVDVAASGLEAVKTAIAEPSAADTIVIVGRNTSRHSTSGSLMLAGSSSVDESRALGPLATSVIKLVRETQLNVGLLVMQARRELEQSGPSTTVVGGAGMQHLTKKLSIISDD